MKGISKSSIPYVRAVPSWQKKTPEEVTKVICELARKGVSPSRIGLILRDRYGVGQVRFLTGSKIIRILKANGLAPKYPEDLTCLIRKAVSIRKHLSVNTRDKDAKFRLILIESRIHRLARYYRRTRQVEATFGYKSATASTLIA
ncbi:putative multi-domain containing protein [Aduncisulcus paluster]|uniref:Multi-domain containing protein n=1 Tax=Aduncisulcus paluster TaxID=2918883 RepID=A0ABQ5JXN8_9EUKA|nr:putative multi-domain containing protein [Aduncisulcus paluster]